MRFGGAARKRLLVAGAILLLIPLGWLVKQRLSERRPERIRFLVPVGFRGVFAVIEDPGAPVAPRNESGSTLYVVPSDGRLRTSNVQPLRSWHAATAAFANGAPLAVGPASPVAPFSDDTVKLRELGADAEGRFFFLVGTEAEQAKAEKGRSYLFDD